MPPEFAYELFRTAFNLPRYILLMSSISGDFSIECFAGERHFAQEVSYSELNSSILLKARLKESIKISFFECEKVWMCLSPSVKFIPSLYSHENEWVIIHNLLSYKSHFWEKFLIWSWNWIWIVFDANKNFQNDSQSIFKGFQRGALNWSLIGHFQKPFDWLIIN